MFRLQRFLSIANFLAIAVAVVSLSVVHYYLETSEHMAVGERENIALSRILQNTHHPLYAPLLLSRANPLPGDLSKEEAITGLRKAFRQQIRGTSVVEIKIYDLKGGTVFSTQINEVSEHKEIKEIKGLYQRAIDGQVVSKQVSKDWTSEAGVPINDVLETYIPIRDERSDRVIGVFELYSDISPLISDMQKETLILAFTILATMLMLYLGLLVIGHRAQRVIRRQHHENELHLKELEQASATLESQVELRTAELSQSNTDLKEEIYKRERMEVALRDSETKFRLITASAHDGILVVDSQGRLSYWNRAAEQLFGYSADEALGRPLIDFVIPKGGTGFSHYGEFRAELGEAGDQAVTLVASACFDKRIPIEVSHSRVSIQDEKNIILMVRDIRDRLAAEAQVKADLQAQQVISAILRAALEPMPLVAKLQRILEMAVKVHCFEGDASAAFFLNQESDKVAQLTADTGLDPEWVRRCQTLALDEGLVEEALLFRQVLFVDEVAGDAVEPALSLGDSAVAQYIVPVLSANGTHYGLLIIYGGKGKARCSNQESFLQMVSHTLANTIEFHLADNQVQRLSHAVEQSHTSIVITDRRGRIEYVNPRFSALSGYSREEAKGKTPALLGSGLTPAGVYDELWRALLSGREWRGELLNRKKSGELFWESESISPIKDEQGEVTHFIAVKEDITEAKKHEELLRVRTRAMEASNNAICILDAASADCNVIYVNPSFCYMTGYQAAEVLNNGYISLFAQPHEQPQLSKLRDAMASNQQLRLELMASRKEGEYFWCELGLSPVYDQQSVATHYVLIMEDITDRKQTEQQLIRLATHDGLTKLPNRSLLKDRLDRALAHSRRHGSVAALLFIDLDQFKIVNDSLGHSAGDLLLKEVGRRMSAAIRESDTLGRHGGDEFVIVANDLTDATDINALVDKVFTALEQPFRIVERDIEISCSVGVSRYPIDGEDGETLFRLADIAMYQAKAQGGKTYCVYDPEMGAQLSEKARTLADLRHALEADELLLHYQPKVDLRSGRVMGSEALIRWQHPDHGMVPPGKFIHVAEESGLIVPIGEWVLNSACRQQQAWLEAGLDVASVSVNLSARQLREVDLLGLVRQALARSGLAPEHLELEITESMMMENPEAIIHTLDEVRALGVEIAIDDFGTGYSSLAYLKRFPVDRVKIDQLFIRNIVEDPADVAIVDSTITMSHNLRCKVIAEGVETQAQLRQLQDMGCDEIQGYYFSRPLPAEQFERLLIGRRRIDMTSLSIAEATESTVAAEAEA